MIAWNKKDELWVHLDDGIEIHTSKGQLKFLAKDVEEREQPQSVNIWIGDRKQLKRLRRSLKKIHQHLIKAELKKKKTPAPDGTGAAETNPSTPTVQD